ncbi:MAG: hypothetical protein GC156_10725 [Actinomycetales bacterium]|nr:hypothetical protein [Actinomycetales bacterium]
MPTGRLRTFAIPALTVLALMLSVALVTLTAVNRMTDSDPMGSLLVAESLVDRHTVFLDGYYPDVLQSLSTRIEMIGGRPAYLFPIGTSLLAVPIVAVLHLFGIGVVPHDHQIQIGMAAAAAALTVLLLYLLARRFVAHWTAAGLAAAFWFGTALSSTGATALWSHDYGVVLSLLALVLLVKVLRDRTWRPLPWLVLALAAAVVIRPQLALLAVGVLLVLAVVWWRAALVVLTGLAAAGALALVAGHQLTGEWLPSYYLPQRLSGGEFWVALAGNLVSPARGFLIYTPMILALPLLAYARGRLARDEVALLALSVGWPVAHLIAISRFPHWWGGWAYGPRLMMDVIPGLALATVLLWPTWRARLCPKVAISAFTLLSAAGIWINTVQGLYNPYTRFWYIEPSVDLESGNVWDWSYPQFLASEGGHEDRLERSMAAPPPLRPGVAYPPEAPELGFVGWSTGFTSPGISLDSFQLGPSALLREDGRRWSEGSSARLVFALTPESLRDVSGTIRIPVDLLGVQRVEMSLNGTPIYDSVVGPDRAIITAGFDPTLLRGGENRLTFTLPDAASVGQASDYRVIAIALKQFTLE